MIYLIGGAPRVGKTTIAKRLMDKTGGSWVSTDVLGVVAKKMTPPDLRSKRFPYRGFSDDEQISVEETIRRVSWQLTEAESTWPLLRAFIEAQAESDDYIFEGVHILPQHVNELASDAKLRGKFCVTFVLTLEVERQFDDMRRYVDAKDWLRGASDGTFRAVADFAVAYSWHIKTECDRLELPYVIRNGDFEVENNKIIELIVI